MNLLSKSLLVAVSAFSISACTMHSRDIEELSEYKHEFRSKNLNVYLKSFSDHRQGRQAILPEGEGIMYAFKPEDLTNGTMLSYLGVYLYNALDKKDKNAVNQIGIDVSIRDVETVIRTGNFKTGRLGYYSVSVKARVIVKDITRGEILTSFPIVVAENKARTSQTGRQPEAALDNKKMLDILDRLALKLADEVLEETEENLEKIYQMDKSGDDVIYVNNKSKLANGKEFNVKQVSEDELNVSPEIIRAVEQQESSLIERKDQQRILYEKKILEQKWLEHLEELQD
mgnify:CR=1 FL=1